ncbi:MAG: acyl-CoA dehydrogenase, partial [Rhodospirillaceae bacterium]|nr:acyl-CoA dehydrogenase [Rhodospirillaceae bacterium]
MTEYTAPLRDVSFALSHIAEIDTISTFPGYEDATADICSAIIEEAGKFAEQVLAPINQSGDQQGCRIENGVVYTPDGFKEAYKAYAEGGWAGLTGEVAYGGQGMPKTLSALIEEMSFAANSSFALFTILTTGATLT